MYAPLRYITHPEKTSKGKELLFLYQENLMGKEFAQNLLSLKEKTLSRWQDHAQSSRGAKLPSLLNQDLKTVEGRCKAYGAYLRHSHDKSSAKY